MRKFCKNKNTNNHSQSLERRKMKTLTTALTAVLLMLCLALTTTSCGKKEIIPDANWLSAVRQPDTQTQRFLDQVDNWANSKSPDQMSAAEFKDFIYKSNPDIDWDVRSQLLSYNKINHGEKVVLKYHYFTGESNKARIEDSSGKYYPATFKNKFVVEVMRQDGQKLWVALACLNGMLEIQGTPAVSAEANMDFVISKGKGLSYYLRDDYWAINVAEAFHLKMYKGKIQTHRHKISYDRARGLVPTVKDVQLTVHTEIGWRFRLHGDDWTLNGKRPKK